MFSLKIFAETTTDNEKIASARRFYTIVIIFARPVTVAGISMVVKMLPASAAAAVRMSVVVAARRWVALWVWMAFAVWLAGRVTAQEVVAAERLRVMFWNVENLFDTDDNLTKEDDDFLPQGTRHWTEARLYAKLIRLTQVVVAAGEGEMPALIGLAEVEGDSVMEHWTRRTLLRAAGYEYCVTASPDVRGINVALMWRPERFRLLGWESVRIPLPADCRPTRDVLHAWGVVAGGDTMDVVVCHLPSRLGGTRRTAVARRAARGRLRTVVDSLAEARAALRMVVMGDMNDGPDTRSLLSDMRLKDPPTDEAAVEADALYNLMLPMARLLRRDGAAIGSYKYRGRWEIIDQFWITGRLWPLVSGIRIFAPPWIMEEEPQRLGHRPRRTYQGYVYQEGFSDHLPILMDIQCRPVAKP